MMRGRRAVSVAVRSPSGEILLHREPLSKHLYAPWSRWPFLRGLIILWDTLVLGVRALIWSANVALEEEEAKFEGPVVWGTLILSLAFALGLFLFLPVFLVGFLDPYLDPFLSNFLEGVIRLLLFLGYLVAIGYSEQIRRVFAYHGAEHKTIHAYEHEVALEPSEIQRFPTAHPRCGTSFLLSVVVISILLFALLGPLPFLPRLLSRLLLLPILVAVSYEFIRFTARHPQNQLLQLAMAPGLALQGLTTRQPDDRMVEVAIAALKPLLAEEGSEGTSS
ncbi:MAG: DUF1385 domain-containing protein [Chloroflexi bacterium]|nr:DUF1385 domain-containing protein [Chloroflexota bacterium]